MKHFDNTDDMELSRLLKEQLPEAGRNEWFTRKVMNRLPEKQQRSFGWLLPLAFTVSIILCLVGWVYFLHNLNLEIILVRDVVTLATRHHSGGDVAIPTHSLPLRLTTATSCRSPQGVTKPSPPQ